MNPSQPMRRPRGGELLPFPGSVRGGTDETRLTPQSLEAEQSALGAMLMNDPDIVAAGLAVLQADDFYREGHRIIFGAIRKLHTAGEPVDLVTVSEELRKRDVLEDLGGSEYISALIEACPSSASIDSYAAIVLETAQKRRAVVLAEELKDLAYNGEISSAQVRSQLTAKLEAMAKRQPAAVAERMWSAQDIMVMEFESARCAVENLLPIGLSIFAGKPKIGKSWLSYAAAIAVAAGGRLLGRHPVMHGESLYLALEDTPRRLKERLSKLLCGEAPPAGLNITTEWPRLDDGGLEKLGHYLTEHPDCRLVVIDTFQKVRPRRSGGNVYEEDYDHLGALKRLADQHECSIVVVMHVSKRDTTDVLESVSGSEGQNGAADATLVLKRERNAKEGTLFVTGRDIDEREIPLKWDAGIGSWAEIDEDLAREAAVSAERQRITEFLREAGYAMSPGDLADALGMKRNNVYGLLHKMKATGELAFDPIKRQYSAPRDQAPASSADFEQQSGEAPAVQVPLWAEEQTAPPSEKPSPADSESYRLTGKMQKNEDANPDKTDKTGKIDKTIRFDAPKPPPPQPTWLAKATADHDVGAHLGANFWQFWHERYDAECQEADFRQYFPPWLNDAWP